MTMRVPHEVTCGCPGLVVGRKHPCLPSGTMDP